MPTDCKNEDYSKPGSNRVQTKDYLLLVDGTSDSTRAMRFPGHPNLTSRLRQNNRSQHGQTAPQTVVLEAYCTTWLTTEDVLFALAKSPRY